MPLATSEARRCATEAFLDAMTRPKVEEWRRERDSNPWYGFPYTRFPSVLLQPLGHLSVRLALLAHDRPREWTQQFSVIVLHAGQHLWPDFNLHKRFELVGTIPNRKAERSSAARLEWGELECKAVLAGLVEPFTQREPTIRAEFTSGL